MHLFRTYPRVFRRNRIFVSIHSWDAPDFIPTFKIRPDTVTHAPVEVMPRCRVVRHKFAALRF